jgi:hypothetical protein
LLLAAASQAHAGAGQTSAGVTTTVGSDPTAATQDVQSQSSNFVQANQALANGTTGMAGTATGTTLGSATATRNGQPGSDPNNPGKPGDPNNPSNTPNAANAKPAAPAAPPAPPPDYVSNIKKVDRSATVAAVVPAVAASGEKSASSTAKSTAPADNDPSAVTAPGVQRQAARQKPATRAAEPDAGTGAERVAEVTGSSGGSGEPPDSFTFYIGLIIAGALLAFAAAMFLRVEKGVAK